MCPLYAAGEKKIRFNSINFAKLIAKNSKTQVIIVKNEIELNDILENLISNEIVIGMGAGLISKWMAGLNQIMTIDNNLMKKFGNNFNKNVKLSNYSWFNLGGNAEYFFKAKNKVELLEFLKEVKKNLKQLFWVLDLIHFSEIMV